MEQYSFIIGRGHYEADCDKIKREALAAKRETSSVKLSSETVENGNCQIKN